MVMVHSIDMLTLEFSLVKRFGRMCRETEKITDAMQSIERWWETHKQMQHDLRNAVLQESDPARECDQESDDGHRNGFDASDTKHGTKVVWDRLFTGLLRTSICAIYARGSEPQCSRCSSMKAAKRLQNTCLMMFVSGMQGLATHALYSNLISSLDKFFSKV